VNALALLPFFKYPIQMKNFEEFEHLLDFDQDVLQKIVREGETMLEAQLATANAADQRALTYLGYLVATATAVVGAAVALLLSETPRLPLVVIAFAFAGLLLFCAFKALQSVTPKEFSFPGNLPQNWFTADWNFSTEKRRDLPHALVEQCYTLNQAISKNKKDMDQNAAVLKKAISISIKATAISGLALLAYALITLLPPCACTQ
jgi:hypothetical protein